MQGIAGPVFRIEELIACGCRVRREEDSSKLRLWFCATHASAFEMLEALQAGLAALDNILDRGPDAYDEALTMDAAMKVRGAVRKGQGKVRPSALLPKSPFGRKNQ